MSASLLHINTMPQPCIYMLFLESSTAYEQPFVQARSASALVSILSAVATRKFYCVQKERAAHLQLCQGHEPFVFIPHMCDVQSVRVVGER